MICIDVGNISRFIRLSIGTSKRSARLRYLVTRTVWVQESYIYKVKWKPQHIFNAQYISML